jgi:NAD(P)-dependent dehydrogenase (short-subunit alcohol dehydrogenase family)
MGELQGKVALITGAGFSMGKASAKVLVREGAFVVVADISSAVIAVDGGYGIRLG